MPRGGRDWFAYTQTRADTAISQVAPQAARIQQFFAVCGVLPRVSTGGNRVTGLSPAFKGPFVTDSPNSAGSDKEHAKARKAKREERLGAELRANLKRRKAAVRGRDHSIPEVEVKKAAWSLVLPKLPIRSTP